MIIRIYGLSLIIQHRKFMMNNLHYNQYAEAYGKAVDLDGYLTDIAVSNSGVGMSTVYSIEVRTLEEYCKLYDKLSSVARVKVNAPDDIELTDGMYEDGE